MSEPLLRVRRRRPWTRIDVIQATRHYGKLEFEFQQKGPTCAGYTYYWLASKMVPPGTPESLSTTALEGVVSSSDWRRQEEPFQKVKLMAEKLQEDVHDREKLKRNMFYLSPDMQRALTLSDNALHFFGERGISVQMIHHGNVEKTSGAPSSSSSSIIISNNNSITDTQFEGDANKDLIGWLIAYNGLWRYGMLSMRYDKEDEKEHGHAVGIYNGTDDETDLWQQLYFFDPNLGEFSFSCLATFWEWLYRVYVPYFFDPNHSNPRTYKYFKFAKLARDLTPRVTASITTTTTTTTSSSPYGTF